MNPVTALWRRFHMPASPVVAWSPPCENPECDRLVEAETRLTQQLDEIAMLEAEVQALTPRTQRPTS